MTFKTIGKKKAFLLVCLVVAVGGFLFFSVGFSSAAVKLGDPLGEDKGIEGVTGVAKMVINSALGVMGGIALIIVVYGGATLLLSAGRSEWVQRGWTIITWAIIGLITVIISYVLLNFVLLGLAGLSGQGGDIEPGDNGCESVEGQFCSLEKCNTLSEPREEISSDCPEVSPYCCGDLIESSCEGECKETETCGDLSDSDAEWTDAAGDCVFPDEACCKSSEYTCEKVSGQNCRTACSANESQAEGTCFGSAVCCAMSACASQSQPPYGGSICEGCWSTTNGTYRAYVNPDWSTVPEPDCGSVPGAGWRRECKSCPGTSQCWKCIGSACDDNWVTGTTCVQ